MTSLFATVGDHLDVAYLNLRSGRRPADRQIAERLEGMWDTPMPQRSGYGDREFVTTENADGWMVTDILA